MPKGKVKSAVGIEFTGDRINLVKLAKSSQGMVLLSAKSIKFSVDKKENEKEILSESIIKAFEGVDYTKDEIALGVGGHMSFVRKVKLPPVSHSKLKQVVSFEVQQQVPFSLNEVIWDHQVISPFSKVPGPIIVLISAIKQSFVENLLKILQESIKKTPDVVDTSSLALHNCLVFNGLLPKEKVGILMNLGFSYTDVSIENKGEMAFTRAVPIGRRNILKKIAESKGIGIEKAEEVLEHEDSSIVLSIWEDLVAEIKRTTNYYLSQIEKVTHFQYIYLAGEFPRDDNLINLLKNSFRVEVKEINPFNKISHDPTKLDAPAGSFSTSTGLALRLLESLPVEINLLPPRILSKKHLVSKRLYFISSLVVLFLIGWIMLISETSSYNLLKEKVNIIGPVLSGYKPYVSQIEKLSKEKQTLTSKLQKIETVLKQKSQLSGILLEISRLTPLDIYITQIISGSLQTGETTMVSAPTVSTRDRRVPNVIDITASPGMSMAYSDSSTQRAEPIDKISLSGIAASYPAVDEYIKQLETSFLFKNVKLVSALSTSEGGVSEISSDREQTPRGRRTLQIEETTRRSPSEIEKEKVRFSLEITIDLSPNSPSASVQQTVGNGSVK